MWRHTGVHKNKKTHIKAICAIVIMVPMIIVAMRYSFGKKRMYDKSKLILKPQIPSTYLQIETD